MNDYGESIGIRIDTRMCMVDAVYVCEEHPFDLFTYEKEMQLK